MEEFSMMDAFKALKDVSDDIIYTTPKKTGKIGAKKKKLSEAITIDLNSNVNEEEAAKAVEEATAKVDRPITIVDVNADTLEHVKDKVDYVGQVILKCKKCQGLKFIDMDKLITSEVDDPNAEGEKIEVYNVEDECPTCHADHEGFEIVGQVSKVPEEKKEGEEETVSNDETPVETEVAEKEEEKEVKETEEETVTEPEEETMEETNEEDEETEEKVSEDNTEDLELPKLGDMIDEEEVEEDDTETNESLEDGKLRGLLNGLSESDGNIWNEEEEEEIFDFEKPIEYDTSEYDTVEDYVKENKVEYRGCNTLNDLFSLMVDPEDIEQCEIYNIDGKLIYRGTCEEIPESLKEEEFGGFHTAGALLPLNIVDEDAEEGDVKVGDVLIPFADREDEVVSIVDQEEGVEVFNGKVDDALEQFKDKKFISMESPKVLIFNLKKPGAEEEEIKTEVSEKDELLQEIFKANNLSKYNLADNKTVESWINEALEEKEHEDLDNVYSSFIRPTHNKDLIEKFKSFTGYRDALDIIKEDFSDILTEEKQEEEPVGKFANSEEMLQAYKRLQADFEEKCKKLKELEDNKQPVDEAVEPAGIRKLKRMLTLNVQTESKEESLEEDVEPVGIRKLKRMYDLNLQTESMEEDTDKENIQEGTEDKNNIRPLSEEALDFVEVTDYDYFFDDESGLVHLSDDFGIEKVDDYINLKFVDDDDENIYTYKVIEKTEDPRLPWVLEYASEQTNFLDDSKVGADEEIEIEDTESEMKETLHDWSREDEEAEKETITRVADRDVAIEVVKKWAEEDLEKDTIKKRGEFVEKIREADIDPSFIDELYDFYLDGVGYIEESLVEAVDDAHKLNPEDKIEIKINGEVVSEGTVKDTFNEESLEEFYKKFTLQNGIYVALEGNEKWEVTIKEKAPVTNVEETKVEEEEKEVSEQLEKTSDPVKKAELQAAIDSLEDEAAECNDKDDFWGASTAFKQAKLLKEENTIAFKTRKELGEAIELCKSKGKQYRVSRSKNEGYRYDLVLVPVECDDECEEHVCPICGKIIGSDCCCPEFDTDLFVNDMNDYFTSTYEEPTVLTISEGTTDKEGKVVLEGVIKSNEKELPVKFLLTPNKHLTEGMNKDEIVYKVTNNLSDETFKFSFNK